MKPKIHAAVILIGLAVLLSPSKQREAKAQVPLFGRYSRIEHGNGSATLSVLDVRPLLEGLKTLREEYSWRIDLEEPIYQSGPRGGKFESTYPENPERTSVGCLATNAKRCPELRLAGGHIVADWGPWYFYVLPEASEPEILNKIVSDYDQGGFSDQYSVIAEPDGGYAVVGTAVKGADGTYRPVAAILDTPISIPSGNTGREGQIDLIAEALSAAGGVKVLVDFRSDVPIVGAPTPGASNVPARTLLRQALGKEFAWSLYYDPFQKVYGLNVVRVGHTAYDVNGQRSP